MRAYPPISTESERVSGSSPCHCVTLRRAARSLTALYDAHLRGAGMTLPQFSILRNLQRLGPQPVSRLAAEVRLDRTTLTRNLRPLRTRSWVEIGRGADLRERTVSLTRAGQAAIARGIPAWERAQAAVEARLGPRPLSALRDALAELERLGT
jgi:DNA-binding MarR family transcriptional regulator